MTAEAPLVLPSRFTIGGEITYHELREAFQAIHQRELPRGAKAASVARSLASSHPLRFEFEINRLRGFAYDG